MKLRYIGPDAQPHPVIANRLPSFAARHGEVLEVPRGLGVWLLGRFATHFEPHRIAVAPEVNTMLARGPEVQK